MSFTIHQIPARRQGSVVTLAEPEVTIAADSAVQWTISGLAEDEVAEVLIQGNRVSELGPFTFSRAGGGSIWVRGSSGFAGDFTYVLSVFKVAGGPATAKAVASSAPARITIAAGPAIGRLGQNILVTFDAVADVLLVDQLNTRFVSGDPVVFEFHLPANLFADAWMPSLIFQDAPPAPVRGFGPFTSLSVLDGANVVGESDGTLRRFLVATGESGLVGTFHYQVLVRSISGFQVVSSSDPVLDNDGEVVCPGCNDQGGK